MLDEHRPHPTLCQGTQRREGLWEGAEELGSERHPHLIDHARGRSRSVDESIEGSADAESFSLYLKDVLCPSLSRGQIVVMDNLSVHKSRSVRELIEARGCELWFLPAYSPDLNPIEEAFSEAFSKAKGMLKKAKARTLEALFEATATAVDAVGEADARGFFSHCGYATPQAHSL